MHLFREPTWYTFPDSGTQNEEEQVHRQKTPLQHIFQQKQVSGKVELQGDIRYVRELQEAAHAGQTSQVKDEQRNIRIIRIAL
jgi:hypothetical protein